MAAQGDNPGSNVELSRRRLLQVGGTSDILDAQDALTTVDFLRAGALNEQLTVNGGRGLQDIWMASWR